MAAGVLSAGHARAISLDDADAMRDWRTRSSMSVIFSVRKPRRLPKGARMSRPDVFPSQPRRASAHLDEVVERLGDRLFA